MGEMRPLPSRAPVTSSPSCKGSFFRLQGLGLASFPTLQLLTVVSHLVSDPFRNGFPVFSYAQPCLLCELTLEYGKEQRSGNVLGVLLNPARHEKVQVQL